MGSPRRRSGAGVLFLSCSPDILARVPKVFVSLNVKRLGQLDRAAKKAGLSRSAYVARLVDRDLEGAARADAAPVSEGDGTGG